MGVIYSVHFCNSHYILYLALNFVTAGGVVRDRTASGILVVYTWFFVFGVKN